MVAAFAASVFSAGCASHRRPTGRDEAGSNAASVPAVEQVSATAEATAAERPSVVAPGRANVFGEIDGMTGRTMSGGDQGLQQHTATGEGYDADVTVDPSGRWMAYASTRHSERPDIYLQRVDGTSVTQLTGDPADDVQPTFSPDGRRIAFASNRSGNWDIYVMDVDGTNVVQVTCSPAQEMSPSFSPDGNRLVYCSLGRDEQWELWVVNLASAERRMIGHGLFPAWSPQKDVDRIAFQRARQRGSRWFSLWTLDLVDGEARRVTEVASSGNAAAVTPAWSPDGQRLAFTTIVSPQDCGGARQDVWVVRADGSGRTRLTGGPGTYLSPCWAAGDRIYFISSRGGAENVWSVRAGSAGVLPVADTK